MTTKCLCAGEMGRCLGLGAPKEVANHVWGPEGLPRGCMLWGGGVGHLRQRDLQGGSRVCGTWGED